MADELGVSKSAVYGKLNRLEPSVSQALVRYSAREMTTIIEQVGDRLPALLPKYRVKILALQWSGSYRASAGSAAKYRSWGKALGNR